MTELRIPFVLWFSDEAPPDLTTLTVPIAIAVAFHPKGETTQKGAKDDSQGPIVTEGAEVDV
ncbi:MAG: hypothetical protein WA864_19380 [Acetobacteraceae bacterium]|jgi:hypothetical protein